MPAPMPTSPKDLSVRMMSEDGLFDSSSESELTQRERDHHHESIANATTTPVLNEDLIMTDAPPDSDSEFSGTPTHSPHHSPSPPYSRRHTPTSTFRTTSPALTAKLASAKKELAVVQRDLARRHSSVAILTKWSDSAKHALALSRADIDALTEALHACMRRLHEMTVEAGDLNDELAETRRMLRKVHLGRAKERQKTRELRGRLKKMRVEVNMNRLGMSRPEDKARYVSTESDTEMASQPHTDPSLAPSTPAEPSAPPPEPSASTSRPPPVSFPASVTAPIRAPAAPPSLTPTDAVHMLTALNAQILQTASQLAEACRTVPGFLPPIARTGTLALASPSRAYKPDDYPCPLDMATYAILLQDAAERVHDIAGERMAVVLDQMRERVTGLRLVEVPSRGRNGQVTMKVEDLAVASKGMYKRETEDMRRVHPLDPTLLQLALQTCMVVHCARAIRCWMSGADVWEDREDMLDRLWDRFRETEPPSISHPWHVLTTQHLQELSSSCSSLPYSYGTPTLSPAHTPSHLLAASIAAVMLLAGVPEAFTRLFCSRYRGTLASLLDNARGLREALGVMGASASEEVEKVIKEEEQEEMMKDAGGDAGKEEGSKAKGVEVDETVLDQETAQSLADAMESQEGEKKRGDDGRRIEKGHDIAPEDKSEHESGNEQVQDSERQSGNEQVQENGKGKEKDAEEVQSTADGEQNTEDEEKEGSPRNQDEEEKETEREQSEGSSKGSDEDVITEDEHGPPQAEEQPKAKAPKQQQENSKTPKETKEEKNNKTVQCWRASYFEVRIPDAYGDGLVDTETMEDECADGDVDMDGGAAAVSILGVTALGLARVDFERGELDHEVQRAEVLLVRPRVVSENILGWTGQERDGVDGDVTMGVA